MEGLKSGIRSTEFWLSLATTAWALLSHALPPVAQAVIGLGVPAAYNIGRAIVKAQAVKAAKPGPVVNTLTVGNP